MLNPMASINRYKTDDGQKKYLARITLKGFKRIGKSFDTKEDAREWADRIEAELKAQRARGGTRTEVGTLTLLQLIKAFLADPNVKQLKWYPDLEQLLASWVDEYGGTRVRSFGRLQMASVRDKLLGQGRSNARVNRYLAALRRVWTWGLENGYVLPSAGWPSGLFLKEPPAKEVIATSDEVAAVFDACDKIDSALGILVRFLRVFWQFEHRMAPRWHWLQARKNFPETLRTMRLHDCRHLCASLLAANGATDVELAAQLGHSTLQTVKRYSHLRGGHRGAAHEKLDKALGG